jgi:hypothetical protein
MQKLPVVSGHKAIKALMKVFFEVAERQSSGESQHH